jgi:hypothetical protein
MRLNIDNSRIRGSVIDGPAAVTFSNQAISGAFTVSPNSPYMIVLNPGVTTQNVTMYTPQAPNVMWSHEIWNSAAATGVLTLKNIAGATIGSIAVGKRAEVVFNPAAVPPDWSAFLSA